jgi:hypothetical protein
MSSSNATAAGTVIGATLVSASPHFSTPGGGATVVAPMRLSPTRGSTAPLSDDPPEPDSDWYFAHDGIDAAFLSHAASELERSEAMLSQSQSQSSQQSFPVLSQPLHEVIFVDDRDDKENASVRRERGIMRRTAQGRLEIDGSVIDLSAEIIEGPRIQPPRVDNDDVISIGSDD